MERLDRALFASRKRADERLRERTPIFDPDTVQITLNKAPLSPATATVAWFVVN